MNTRNKAREIYERNRQYAKSNMAAMGWREVSAIAKTQNDLYKYINKIYT